MKKIIGGILGLWLVGVSALALGTSVTHSIDISDTKNTWLSIDLRAGDELILYVTGWKDVNGVNMDVAVNGLDLVSNNVTYNAVLDRRYFIPNDAEARNCYRKILGIKVEKNGFNTQCAKLSYYVIKNSGRYTSINITSSDNSNPLQYTRALVNKASSWEFTASGGFVISGLTNKKYYSETQELVPAAGDTPAVTGQFVARNKNAEDSIALGMGAFVHTCYADQGRRWYWVLTPDCVTFGLSLSDQSGELNYLPGLSWKMGDEFYLTLGAQFAKVDALPRGLKVGDPINSANDLATLDSRYETAWALTFSYRFMGDSTKQSFSNAVWPTTE